MVGFFVIQMLQVDSDRLKSLQIINVYHLSSLFNHRGTQA